MDTTVDTIGARHRLAPSHRAASVVEVARSMVALHATDPASVHLAVVARTAGPGASVADIDAALWDGGELVRLLAMRRTMWVVPRELEAIVVAACSRKVAAAERRRWLQRLAAAGVVDDVERWLKEVEDDVLAAVGARGEALANELAADVPALRTKFVVDPDKTWGAEITATRAVLGVLSAEGRLVRGRPAGSWLSTQHRYRLAPPVEDIPEADAQAALARRWLAAFGPAPAADLQWWAGWTAAATKRALAAAGPVEEPAPVDEPWAALLPALDPTTMGWKARDHYLGGHGAVLFDRSGNAGPTIWWCGRIVGGWAQRADGTVVTRLLDDVGGDGRAAVDAETDRLQAWLDAAGAVVKPRFPSPLHKELVA